MTCQLFTQLGWGATQATGVPTGVPSQVQSKQSVSHGTRQNPSTQWWYGQSRAALHGAHPGVGVGGQSSAAGVPLMDVMQT